jgi:hypothetical protein
MTQVHKDQTKYREIEEVLALSVPFGDSAYLNQNTWSRYADRLEMLSGCVPSAKALGDAVRHASDETKYCVIGDPTVRNSINSCLVHFRLKHASEAVAQAAEIIQLTRQQVEKHIATPPLQVGVTAVSRLGQGAYDAWMWTDDRREDPNSRYFRMMVEKELGPAHLKLLSASSSQIEMLAKGAELLRTLLPQLANSALSHTHLVALLSHPPDFTSVTNPQIPGVIFLSPSVLSTPWKVAEYLLHESLHLKFIDAEHTHSLLPKGYKQKDCLIRPPWRRPHTANPYLWPLNRVLTVAHVYTALSLFFLIADAQSSELAPVYGSKIDGLPQLIQQSLDRAEFLTGQLQLNSDHLGKAGQHFVRWLDEVVGRLQPFRRPMGCYLHLVSDLYDTEASTLARVIARVPSEKLLSEVNLAEMGFNRTTLIDVLSEMLQNEISCVHEIAEKSGQPLEWVDLLSQTVRQERRQSSAELATLILGTRALVCQSLQKIPAGRYTTVVAPLILDDLLLSSSRYVEATRRHLNS